MSEKIIESYERQTFPPTDQTKNNLNEYNKKIDYEIPIGDSFSHPNEAYINFLFKITKRDKNQNYEKASTIDLCENFFPYLFSKIEISKHGNIIETIENPGITSTMMHSLLNSIAESSYLQLSMVEKGFGVDKFFSFRADKLNEVSYPLKYLFGFIRDCNDVYWKGGYKISFIRGSNDDVCIYRQPKYKDDKVTVDTVPDPGKIIIEKMEILWPVVEYEPNYSDKIKAKLYKEPNIPIYFNYWQCLEKVVPTGSNTFQFDIKDQFNSIQFDMPDYVIVGFQTNRKDDVDQNKHASLFNHCNVRNISIKNGRNEVFPKENWNLDIENNIYDKMYVSYKDFRNSRTKFDTIYRNNEMYFNPNKFISERAIYVIDCSYRKTSIVKDRTNIKLTVDFNKVIPANTICYVVLISLKNLIYDVKSERITEEVL